MDTTDKKEPFWMHTPLNKMTPSQWESLCDGCGKCCLLKVQEAATQQCAHYKDLLPATQYQHLPMLQLQRTVRYVDDCIKLNPTNVQTITWLPKSCAYRLVKEKKALPNWHPLITKDPQSTVKSGNSVKSFVVHPALVNKAIITYLLEETIH